MTAAVYGVASAWPPPLESYEYMRTLSGRDWAWEALRRNPRYRAEALAAIPRACIDTRLEGGTRLTRMPAPEPGAEAWALLSFC